MSWVGVGLRAMGRVAAPVATPTNQTPHIDWRLLLNDGTGTNGQYTEIRFLDANDNILSTGGTPVASSTLSGSYPVTNVFDNVTGGNRHVFNGIPANSFYRYTFAAAALPKKIQMWTSGFQQWFRTAQVQWSDNGGASWNNIGPARSLIWPGFNSKIEWWIENPDDTAEAFPVWQLFGLDTNDTAFPDFAQYNEIKLFDAQGNQLTIIEAFSPDGDYDGTTPASNLYDGNTASTRWASAKQDDGSSIFLRLSAAAAVARAELYAASSYQQVWKAIDLYGCHDYYNRQLKRQVSGIPIPTASGQKTNVNFITGVSSLG